MGSSSSKAANSKAQQSSPGDKRVHYHSNASVNPSESSISYHSSHAILHSELEFRNMYLSKEETSKDISEWLAAILRYFQISSSSGQLHSSSGSPSLKRNESSMDDLDNSSTLSIQWKERQISERQLLELSVHTVPMQDIEFIEIVPATQLNGTQVLLLRIVTTDHSVWMSDMLQRDWNYIMVNENLMQCEYYFQLYRGQTGSVASPNSSKASLHAPTSPSYAADTIKLPANPSLWHYLTHRFESYQDWKDTMPHHWKPIYFTKFQPLELSYYPSKKIELTLRESYVKAKFQYAEKESQEEWILQGVLLDADDREEIDRCVNTYWNGKEWEMNITFPESGAYYLRVDACKVNVAQGEQENSPNTPLSPLAARKSTLSTTQENTTTPWISLGVYKLETDTGIASLPTEQYCKLYPEVDLSTWQPVHDALIEPEIGAFPFATSTVSFVYQSETTHRAFLVNQHRVVEMRKKGIQFFASEKILPGKTFIYVQREGSPMPVLLYTYQSNVHRTHVQYEPQALINGVRFIDSSTDSYEREFKFSLPSQFQNLKSQLRNLRQSEIRHDAVFTTRREDEVELLCKLPGKGDFAVEFFADYVADETAESKLPVQVYVPKSPKKNEKISRPGGVLVSQEGQNKDAVSVDTNNQEAEVQRNLLFSAFILCEDETHELSMVRQIYPLQHDAFFKYHFELMDPMSGELEASEHTFELSSPSSEIEEVIIKVPDASMKPQVIGAKDGGTFSSGWSGSLLQQEQERMVRRSVKKDVDRHKTLQVTAKTKVGEELPLLTYTVVIDRILAEHSEAADHDEVLASLSESQM